MGRSPCCEKVGLKKGTWTPEEDKKLLAYIDVHGRGSWRALPSKAGLQRCGKSCRLRWTNYLRPDIKRGEFTMQEEHSIIQLHALLGNRWSAIATHLPKRTDNEIKNYWNTHLKKRLAKMGIDPVTHKPKSDALAPADGHTKSAATLDHMAQWESARLEAEARLVRESSLRGGSTPLQPPPPILHPVTPYPSLNAQAWQSLWPMSAANGNRREEGHAIDLDSPSSTLSQGSCNYEQDKQKSDSYNDTATATVTATTCFTGMQNSSEELEDADNARGSCVDVEEGDGEGEENKDYWCSILDLVYSFPSNLPPPVF